MAATPRILENSVYIPHIDDIDKMAVAWWYKMLAGQTSHSFGQPCSSRHLHKFDLLRLQNSSHLSLCTDVQVVHELRRHHWVVLPAFRNATVPPEQEFVFVLRSPSRSGLLPFSPGPLATVWLLIRERGGRRCVGEFSSTDDGFSDVQGWNRSVWRNSLE